MSDCAVFPVRQTFYAGIGWSVASLCLVAAGGSYLLPATREGLPQIFFGFSLLGAWYAVINRGRRYELHEQGVAIATWRRRVELARWDEVVGVERAGGDKSLHVILRDGARLAIRLGEVRAAADFEQMLRSRIARPQ